MSYSYVNDVAVNSGATWQTAQTRGHHTALDNGNSTEVNGSKMNILDKGSQVDAIGDSITRLRNGGIRLDGLSSYAMQTISGVVAIVIKYNGDVIINNNGTYYVNGVETSPDTWPFYQDTDDNYLGKSDASTFHDGIYNAWVLDTDVLSASDVNNITRFLT